MLEWGNLHEIERVYIVTSHSQTIHTWHHTKHSITMAVAVVLTAPQQPGLPFPEPNLRICMHVNVMYMSMLRIRQIQVIPHHIKCISLHLPYTIKCFRPFSSLSSGGWCAVWVCVSYIQAKKRESKFIGHRSETIQMIWGYGYVWQRKIKSCTQHRFGYMYISYLRRVKHYKWKDRNGKNKKKCCNYVMYFVLMNHV